MADRTWTLLLVLAGNRVGIWQSPTGRYFVAHPYYAPEPVEPPGGWQGAATDGEPSPELILPHGYSRLPDAIRAAAEHEVALRGPRLTGDWSRAVRAVLWETQPTQSCIHASPRVQLAVNAALTALRGCSSVRRGSR